MKNIQVDPDDICQLREISMLYRKIDSQIVRLQKIIEQSSEQTEELVGRLTELKSQEAEIYQKISRQNNVSQEAATEAAINQLIA